MLNTTYDNSEKTIMNQKQKIFVYINSHAAHFVKSFILKKYLNNKIGHNKWISCNEVIIPESLQVDKELFTESFFHGITTYQYTIISNGGTFVNPLLYGLTTDFIMWNDIIHTEPNFFQDVVYIDIPFEMYKEIAQNDTYFVDEEEYRETSNKIQTMVKKLKDTYYSTGTVLH